MRKRALTQWTWDAPVSEYRAGARRTMRFDDLPQSDNIEDRRGDSSAAEVAAASAFRWAGGGGLGIGTIVILGIVGYALGIDPRLLIGGAEMIVGRRAAAARAAQPSGKTGAPSDEMGKFVSRVLGSADVQSEADLRAGRPALPHADAGDVLRRDARRSMRHGAVRDGAVLLPERSEDLSRHLVLPRSRAPLQRLRCRLAVVPVRAGLCDRA